MLSIRLSEIAEKELKEIANFEGLSVSDYVRNIINEKLEEQFDLTLGEKSLVLFEETGSKTILHEELIKELDL